MEQDINIYAQSVTYSVFAIVIFFAGYLLRWFFAGKKLQEAQNKAKSLLADAEKETESKKKEIELQSKDMMIKLRQDFERETKDRREELVVAEKRILQKEENLEKRVDLLEKKEKDLTGRLTQLQDSEESIKKR